MTGLFKLSIYINQPLYRTWLDGRLTMQRLLGSALLIHSNNSVEKHPASHVWIVRTWYRNSEGRPSRRDMVLVNTCRDSAIKGP